MLKGLSGNVSSKRWFKASWASTALFLTLTILWSDPLCFGAEPDVRLWVEGMNGGTAGKKDKAVLVNGKPVHVAFDTGTAISFVLFEECVRRLGLEVEVPVPQQDRTPGRTRLGATVPCAVNLFGDPARIGPLAIAHIPADVLIRSNEDLDGFIGWPGMKSSIWSFQLADKLYGECDEIPPEVIATWTKLSISQKNDTLSLNFPAESKGVRRMIIDTGNSEGVMLVPEHWKEWKENNPDAPLTLEGDHIPGQSIGVIPESWASEFLLGPLLIKDVPISRADDAYVQQAEPGEKVIAIGLAGLARLELFLDPQNQVAYCRPSESPALPFHHNRMGVVFVPRKGSKDELVAAIAPGGPAALAGLRDGDRLLDVDSKEIDGWRTHPAEREAISGRIPAGSKRTYRVRRNNEVIEITVTAKDILVPQPPTPAISKN